MVTKIGLTLLLVVLLAVIVATQKYGGNPGAGGKLGGGPKGWGPPPFVGGSGEFGPSGVFGGPFGNGPPRWDLHLRPNDFDDSDVFDGDDAPENVVEAEAEDEEASPADEETMPEDEDTPAESAIEAPLTTDEIPAKAPTTAEKPAQSVNKIIEEPVAISPTANVEKEEPEEVRPPRGRDYDGRDRGRDFGKRGRGPREWVSQ